MLTTARLDSFYSALRQQIGDLAWPLDHYMRAAPADEGGHLERNSEENILRVQGEVDEIVKLPSCVLHVEESGKVHGSILVKRATIRGAVSGDIEASERVAVKATGRVQGSITAPRIALEEKGTIDGTLSVG